MDREARFQADEIFTFPTFPAILRRRKLTRTILTPSLHHLSHSSAYLSRFCCDLTEKRGCGRARVALIRKECSTMRGMLVTGEKFHWIVRSLVERKLKAHDKSLGERWEGEERAWRESQWHRPCQRRTSS